MNLSPNPQVVDKVMSLFHEGIWRINEIQSRLQQFLRETIFKVSSLNISVLLLAAL